MAFTWNLAEIRTRFRADIGRSQITDITDSDSNDYINDYFVYHFPSDANVHEFNTLFEQATSATDDGEYSLSTNVERLDDPVTVNRNEIKFYRHREEFFADYPENEQFVTDPTLVIGSSDTTKVRHSAFDYRIQGYSYSKAASEVDLTGDAIPQNKYGAWVLKIDSDGDITVTAADDNDIGYDTPRKALEALDKSDSESCFMGYVTVTKSDGVFTPATTALDDSNVTATYTDGKWELRNVPEAILLYGDKLYARPRPNDIFEIKALTIANRPTALSSDSDAPADPKQGPAIARGAALIYLSSHGGQERIDELAKSTRYFFDSLKEDGVERLLGGQVQRRF